MFGKPQLTSVPVRCLNCGCEYPESDIVLVHAGQTDEGDFWNDRCPECGVCNGMQESYALMDDADFRSMQHEVARSRRDAVRERRRQRASGKFDRERGGV